jgi:hypothetical protein
VVVDISLCEQDKQKESFIRHCYVTNQIKMLGCK